MFDVPIKRHHNTIPQMFDANTYVTGLENTANTIIWLALVTNALQPILYLLIPVSALWHLPWQVNGEAAGSITSADE